MTLNRKDPLREHRVPGRGEVRHRHLGSEHRDQQVANWLLRLDSVSETITLTREAFANEEQLARTLAHERFHVVEQLRRGITYPSEYDAFSKWERAAQEFEDA